MTGWFIDKVNVMQVHDLELPYLGKNGALEFDLFTGETTDVLKVQGKYPVKGSYSTSLRVHCDGSRVYMEGNPSRFGRCENLFGLTSLEDCIAVYNHVLKQLGLPPFTTGRFDFLQGKENEKQKKSYTGAVFTHIDITKNHIVDAGNCYAYLRALSTLSLPNGKHPYLYPNGATVDWSSSKCGGGSSWDYTKCYIKHVDLVDNRSSNLRDASPDDEAYYDQVIEHCKTHGVIREEHSFKAKKLKRYDLCYYGYTSLDRLVKHPSLTTIEMLTQTLEVATMDYVTIADQLIQKHVVKSRQSANATAHVAYSWMNNPSFCDQPKNSQFYVHKKRLKALGLDISIPFRTDRNVLPMVRNQREITRMDFTGVPSFYRKPTTNPVFQLTA
ncbi:phage/plasmid replication domain-containing protein [Alishewanella longhuensis]